MKTEAAILNKLHAPLQIVDDAITKVYPFNKINSAIQDMLKGQSRKTCSSI